MGKKEEELTTTETPLASAVSAAVVAQAVSTVPRPAASPNSHGGAKSGQTHRIIAIIGTIASVMSVIMYVSYIPQIAANLGGHPGVVWQPLAAFFNCVFWTVYGIGEKPRQWPIIVANVPGIFLAAITVITCFVH